MKPQGKVGIVVLIVAALVLGWWRWEIGQPRRDALKSLDQFARSLTSNNSGPLLDAVVLPHALIGRTEAEQAEFLHKALADEISTDGLAVLKRNGQFGSLTNIFPAEATAWSQAAGVNVGDCVAFKLDRNGVRAEVVLASDGPPSDAKTGFRIVRCNNVKQLAQAQ